MNFYEIEKARREVSDIHNQGLEVAACYHDIVDYRTRMAPGIDGKINFASQMDLIYSGLALIALSSYGFTNNMPLYLAAPTFVLLTIFGGILYGFKKEMFYKMGDYVHLICCYFEFTNKQLTRTPATLGEEDARLRNIIRSRSQGIADFIHKSVLVYSITSYIRESILVSVFYVTLIIFIAPNNKANVETVVALIVSGIMLSVYRATEEHRKDRMKVGLYRNVFYISEYANTMGDGGVYAEKSRSR